MLTKSFFIELFRSRSLVLDLAKRDYAQQHQGSYLGFIWNYLQPVLFITLLYGVFTLGFRTGKDMEIPFSIYLVSGMVCWLYLSSNLTNISYVVKSYSFLVKKVDFPLSTLPLVKLLSSFLPHLVLVAITFVLAAYQGMPLGLHSLQIIYYFICMLALLLGVGWLTASTSIFIKDVANLVSIITQFGFWLTPIFWQLESMPGNIQWLLKLNPAYYLVTGYRDSITGSQLFWDRPSETIAFWLTTVTLLIAGATIFKKLKPHFAEVL